MSSRCTKLCSNFGQQIYLNKKKNFFSKNLKNSKQYFLAILRMEQNPLIKLTELFWIGECMNLAKPEE